MSETTSTLVGTRIRVDQFYGAAEHDTTLRGSLATINSTHPDSDGDVQVTLDGHPTTVHYARKWTVLGENDTVPESNPVGSVLPPTHWEAQLENLIDAIYETAQSRGYNGLLVDLFEKAGIPLRPAERVLKVTGLRVVSIDRDPARVGMVALGRDLSPETNVAVNRVFAEYTVSVPWPEQEGVEHRQCYEIAQEVKGDMTLIPDTVWLEVGKAIGLGGTTTDRVREHVTKMCEMSNGFSASLGLTVSCKFCG